MYRKKVAPVTDSYKMKLETTPGKRKTRSQETECSPEKKECKTPRNKVVDALEKLTLTSGKKNSETRRNLYETRHSVSRSPSRGRGRPPNNLSLEPKFVILAETDGNLEMEVDENEENIPPPVKIQRSVGRVKKTPILELEPKETRRSIVRPRNVGEETKARFEEEQEIVVETRGKVVQASPETKYLKIKPILLKKIPDTCAYRISNTPRAPGKVQSQRSVGRVQKMDLDYNQCESSSDSDSEDESSSASSSRSSSPLRKITRRMEKTPGINQAPKNLLDLRSLLHTSEVPEKMPCREEEHKVIRQFIEDGVKQNGVSQAMYISGVPGTGKTASTQAVVKELAKEFNFNYVTVNAMELMDPKQLFIEIYKRVVGEKKRVSAQAARIKLNSMFDKKDKKRPPVVILIDELDMLCTKKQDLLYDVFNWTSCEESRVSVLAIANTLDLPERVMSQRITSRLGTNRVVFQPYTHDQIVKIVQARLSKGSHLVHEQAIEFVSKKVANVSGDLRKAIDLLRRGMEIAVEKGEKRLLFEHVNAAQKESAATPRNVIGESLSRHAFLVFRSALCQVQSNGTEEFQFHELYKQYRLICNTLEGINPIHDYGIHHILMELCSNRLLVASPGTNFTKRRLRLGMPTHDALSIIKQVDDATKDGRIVRV